MTTTTYKYGKHTCKAYKKTAGNGWEVGFMFGNTTIFMGNFIHQKEATAWWTKMNTEVRRFSKRYALPKNASPTFFKKFMTNYLYKAYYGFLNGQFSKYTRNYNTAVRKCERQFTTAKRRWPTHTERTTFRRAA